LKDTFEIHVCLPVDANDEGGVGAGVGAKGDAKPGANDNKGAATLLPKLKAAGAPKGDAAGAPNVDAAGAPKGEASAPNGEEVGAPNEVAAAAAPKAGTVDFAAEANKPPVLALIPAHVVHTKHVTAHLVYTSCRHD